MPAPSRTAHLDDSSDEEKPPVIGRKRSGTVTPNPSLKLHERRSEASFSGAIVGHNATILSSHNNRSISDFQPQILHTPRTLMASSSSRSLRSVASGIAIDIDGDQQRLQARSPGPPPLPQPSREHLQVVPPPPPPPKVEDEQQHKKQPADDEVTITGSDAGGSGRSRSNSAIQTPKPANATLPREGTTPTPTTQNQSPAQQQQQRQPRQSSTQGPKGTGTRYRHTPRLPNHPAEPAPATMMYWSKAPVYGHLPMRCMRGHSITLIENLAWQIAGCDSKGCYADVLTFDTETMFWSYPETVGDIPTPFRAHSATAVDRRIFVFGGGSGMTYYNHLYVLDTVMRRWSKVEYDVENEDQLPIPRRAHATWFFQNRLYLFGGGNGIKALNDVWTLDVHMPYNKMKWEPVDISGPKPAPRGYHTANLINDTVIVIGGSDGQHVYDDVWMLHLPTMTWYKPDTGVPKKRLGHTSTQVGSYLFVIGGHDGIKYNHELQLFNLVTLQWEPRETRGRSPSSRGYHAAVLTDSRIFLFGGYDGTSVFDEVYIMDLAAAAYLPQVTSFTLRLPKVVPGMPRGLGG